MSPQLQTTAQPHQQSYTSSVPRNFTSSWSFSGLSVLYKHLYRKWLCNVITTRRAQFGSELALTYLSTSTWTEENLSGIICLLFKITHGLCQLIFPTGILLPCKFLTTLGWIPFNCISHLHELMLFISLPSLTPFLYGTHPEQVAGSYSQFKHHIRP